jgi:hypothetical protein
MRFLHFRKVQPTLIVLGDYFFANNSLYLLLLLTALLHPEIISSTIRLPACLSGIVKGKLPSFIPKTDETRV